MENSSPERSERRGICPERTRPSRSHARYRAGCKEPGGPMRAVNASRRACAQRRSVPLIPHADKYVVSDGVPGVMNADEEQQQRRTSDDKQSLAGMSVSRERRDRLPGSAQDCRQKQGRAEVNDRRCREGGAGLRRSQRRPLGNERQDDELQTDQGTCSRTDDDVKAIPFGELRHVFSSSMYWASGRTARNDTNADSHGA